MKPVSPAAPLRAIRGIVFTGTAIGLGATAHLAAGGRLPGPVAMVLLAVPVAWVSLFLVRSRRRWPIVITSLLAIEAVLHQGLMTLSGRVDPAASMPWASQGQMAMGPHASAMSHQTSIAVSSADGMAAMSLVPEAGMLAAHAVATVLTGAVLAYGEHLLWRLWTWLHHAVTASTELIALPAPRTMAPAWLLTASPVPVAVDRSVRRRGPPWLGLGLPASA